jgi:hypothetical protein
MCKNKGNGSVEFYFLDSFFFSFSTYLPLFIYLLERCVTISFGQNKVTVSVTETHPDKVLFKVSGNEASILHFSRPRGGRCQVVVDEAVLFLSRGTP